MAQQVVNVGTLPDDQTGDQARLAFQKVNANFTELYNNVPLASVLSFGADPLGLVDSSASFLAAGKASNYVFIPPGTYKLTAGILTFTTGVFFVGASRGSVLINCNSGTSDLFAWTGTGTGGGIMNVRINAIGMTGGNIISNVTQSRWTVRDCILLGGYNGIYVQDQNAATIANIWMSNPTGAYGIKVYGSGATLSQVCDIHNAVIGFSTNLITSPVGILIDGDATTLDIRHVGITKGFRGISVVNTPNFTLGPLFVTAYDVQSDFPYDAPFHFDGGTGSTRTHHLDSCYAQHSQTGNGINITSTAWYCTIANTLVVNNQLRGILDNGRYTKIHGCQVSNNNLALAANPNIELGATSIGSHVTSCLCGQWSGVSAENATYGVLVAAGAIQYTVMNNNLNGNATGPYLDNAGHGTSNIFGNSQPAATKHIINGPIQAQIGQNLSLLADGINTVLLGNATNGTGFAAQAADATTVNFLKAFGHSTGSNPALVATGTDTDIGLTLLPKGAGLLQAGTAACFSANAAVATVLGSVGPTGAATTVQKWLTIKDNGGVTRYIPCF